jgi:hypothetical protein
MRIRKLTAALIAGAALATTAAVATPAGATGSQPASIVDALAASAAGNPAGSATDGNWNDFDILLAAATALPFDVLGDPTGPTLAGALTGFTGTVFAPADASFRGLVADLTDTPIWKLSEADVLNTLLAVAGGTYTVTGFGDVPGAALLSETVKYHVTGDQIPDLRRPPSRSVTTLTQLPAVGLGDGTFDIKRPFLSLVGLGDNDGSDLDPFSFGRTIRTADGGTIHVIAGVLRPVDLAAVQGLAD